MISARFCTRGTPQIVSDSAPESAMHENAVASAKIVVSFVVERETKRTIVRVNAPVLLAR